MTSPPEKSIPDLIGQWRSDEKDPAVRANQAIVMAVQSLVSGSEMRRRGSGGEVLAGALGGMLESLWSFSNRDTVALREMLHATVDQFCDEIAIKKADA